MFESIYKDGDYLSRHPTWHIEDSPWKSEKIIQILSRNAIVPKSVCEVGCGAGEILRQLCLNMDQECTFIGYEISPQALALSSERANERLSFKLKDIRDEQVFFDVLLVIDIIEHLEDYYGFLRDIRPKSTYKVFHIPLDLSVQTVFRRSALAKARSITGHIHYFTKDIAVHALKDVGYEIVDSFYTAGSIELPQKYIKTRLANLPRRMLYAIHKDWAVRLLGGYSLLVLAK